MPPNRSLSPIKTALEAPRTDSIGRAEKETRWEWEGWNRRGGSRRGERAEDRGACEGPDVNLSVSPCEHMPEVWIKSWSLLLRRPAMYVWRGRQETRFVADLFKSESKVLPKGSRPSRRSDSEVGMLETTHQRETQIPGSAAMMSKLWSSSE